MPIYTLPNGKKYNIPKDQIDPFLNKFPNAVIEQEVKLPPTVQGAIVGSDVAPKNMDLALETSSLDSLTNLNKQLLDLTSSYSNPEKKDITFSESVANSLNNMVERIKQISPKINLTSGMIYRKIFGDENINKFVEYAGEDSFWTEGLSEEDKIKAINKIRESQAKSKETGEIIEGFKEGDISDIAGGIFNAATSFVPSLIEGGAGFLLGGKVGAGLMIGTDFFGDSYISINEEKAKRLNISLDELVNSGEDEVLTPLVFSSAMAAAESIGLGKVASAASKQLTGATMRKLSNFILAGAAESGTEVIQTALEKAQQTYGKTDDVGQTAARFAEAFTEQDTWEAGVQGFIGGAGFSGLGNKDVRNAISLGRAPEDIKGIESDIDELSNLNTKLRGVSDKTAKRGIENKIAEVEDRLKNRIIKGNAIFDFASDKDINDINNLDDLAKLQVKRFNDLKEKRNKNKIAEDEYALATEGYKAEYIKAKNRIQGVKENIQDKGNKQAQEVNKLYEEKGKEGIAQILELYRPMAKRIASKYRNVPGFEMDLMVDEILTGQRGILDLINSYKPDTKVPLSAYVNKYAATRGIEAAQRNLKTDFELDVTEARAVTADETSEDTVTQQEQVKQEVKTALAKDLNLDETTQNDIVKAVEKTLGTKLPAVTDKKFRQALTNGFRNELTNTFKTVFGRQASYEQFLRDNFEKIYPAIPQETINRNFKEFNEAVVDPETGKQLREKTAEGKKVFKKRDITKAEFIKYFLNAPGNVKGARKTSLAKVLADEIGLDNVLNALSKEDIKNKFVAVQELQGQEVPANFIEIISEKIDRAIDYIDKWQKSSELRADVGLALAAEFLKKVLQSIRLSIKAGLSITKAIKKAVDEASKIFKDAPTENEKAEYAKEISLSISKYEDIDTLNIDDLMDQLSRIYYKNKGIQEEQNVILSLLDASKKSKLIKVLSKKPAGSNSKGFDVEFEVGGQKINVEVKASDAQYSSMTANFDLNLQEFTLSQQTKFNDLINKELESVKKNISEYAKEAGSKVWPAKISKEKYNELGSSGKNIQKNISKTFEVPYELINELYNKKGINYINIAGKGLYYLGKDIYNLGVPKFNPNASATIRVARTATKKGDVTTTTRIFPKIDYKSLEKSPYNLNDTQSVINLFENTKKTSPQTLNEDFNKIIENKTGIAADQVYKKAKAEVVGASKGKWKFFIPPGAEDFVGLLYATLGKGKLGDQQMAWYKYNLLNPYTDALNNITRDRVQLAKDFKELKKQLKIVPKNLRKKIPGTQYSQQDAVRVYIWNKQGVDMLTEENGMDKADLDQLVEFVEKDSNLLKFADQLMEITQQEYAEPGAKWWDSGTIDADLLKTLSTTRRAKYLEQSGWTENVNTIFSKENLNKLEAAYGKPYRIALENILKRMKSGRNRSFGGDALTSRFTDWISNSIGTIMFLNSRSAVLQTISAVNFINWSDNNILAVAKTFANPKQWAKDFMMLMNSPFLIERRNGLKIDVNESEIADLAKTSTNKAKAIMGQLLKAGFLPTQIADSFAIASGGASFYRNRFNSLVKEGYTKEEAEVIAMRDFRETATESQQSSDPSRISQQQAGPLGRIVLAFANTPAQYARLTKKAVLDIKNGRGDLKTNVSKIIYYMVVQNIIFTALQQALFAVAFGDDDEEEDEMNKKYIRMANSMSDSILRGLGFAGAAVSVAKNVAIKIAQESDKKAPKFEEAAWKLLEISPPISSKISKFRSAGRQISWNRKEIREKGLSLENPAAMAGAQIIAGATNLPVDRALRKIDNVQNALSEDAEMWQRVALLSGWQDWEIGMNDKKKTKKPKKFNPRDTGRNIDRKLKRKF